jgi:hypothetical protein
MGSLSAPRARRYVEPLPLAYRLFRGQRMSCRQRWTWAFQPRRGADEPLRWSVTPAALARATLSQMRPTRRCGSPQAPHPSSQDTDGLQLASSWTRDEVSLVQAGGAGISWAQIRRVGKAKRAHHCVGNGEPVAHPTTPPVPEIGLRPVWRRRRPLPPARRSCRSLRCGRCRTPGCAWRCAPWQACGR